MKGLIGLSAVREEESWYQNVEFGLQPRDTLKTLLKVHRIDYLDLTSFKCSELFQNNFIYLPTDNKIKTLKIKLQDPESDYDSLNEILEIFQGLNSLWLQNSTLDANEINLLKDKRFVFQQKYSSDDISVDEFQR